MENVKYTVEHNVNLAYESLNGLREILGGLESELCADSRYYSLLSVIDDVLSKLDTASEACDQL